MTPTWEAALDTSTGASLALLRDGVVARRHVLHAQGRDSDRVLVPWLQDQLAAAELDVSEITRWTVGTGPGSFSGIRVGMALVQGIATVSGAPVRGVPSSVALARSCGEGLAVVLHDARRGQVIATLVAVSATDVCIRRDPVVVAPEELPSLCGDTDHIVTPHGNAIRDLLPDTLRSRLQERAAVDAADLLAIPGWNWPSTEGERRASCEPVYVRPAVFVKPKRPTRRTSR